MALLGRPLKTLNTGPKAVREDMFSTGKNMLDKQGTSDTSVGRPLGSLLFLFALTETVVILQLQRSTSHVI